LLLYTAMAAFMALGGLEAAFLAVARGFEHMPPGAMAAGGVGGMGGGAESALGRAVALLHSGFELALRVAAPVLCILMLETLAAGLVMKTMPQLNILSIGFAVKIVLGFMALTAAVYAVGEAVGEGVQGGLRAVLMWSTGG
jgi:flagellar biosynthetic protein FliR